VPAPVLVIVNPASRHGAAGRRWRALEGCLGEVLGAPGRDWELERTRGPRDAERIAREGVRAGVRRVVVVGGDGTTSEVVTGLLAADLGAEAEIALLPFGTGGDLPRTLGIPRDPRRAAALLAEGKVRRLDAGRVRLRGRAGRPATYYFLNVASLGLGGLVCELVNASPKLLGGTASFLIGSLRAIARWKSPPVTLRLDGEVVHEGPLALAAAANGRFFGGGMQVAPQARPDDGLLDVVVIPGLARIQLAAKLPLIYRGAHLSQPGTRLLRGLRLEAEPDSAEAAGAEADTAVWVEVDGEPLGTLPAEIEILPGAIAFVGAGGVAGARGTR